MTETVGRDSNFSLPQYQALAELRFQIRSLLQPGEEAARAQGIEPQQHQLLLAIKGLPVGMAPTVTTLAARLCLRHHSTVELVNRSASRGTVIRHKRADDRRHVLVKITSLGEQMLEQLKMLHQDELIRFTSTFKASLRRSHPSLKTSAPGRSD